MPGVSFRVRFFLLLSYFTSPGFSSFLYKPLPMDHTGGFQLLPPIALLIFTSLCPHSSPNRPRGEEFFFSAPPFRPPMFSSFPFEQRVASRTNLFSLVTQLVFVLFYPPPSPPLWISRRIFLRSYWICNTPPRNSKIQTLLTVSLHCVFFRKSKTKLFPSPSLKSLFRFF